MNRRALQKLQTRQRVLDGARRCFRAHGFEATTIARVAREAEVAVGTVISHFPDKASLVAAAFHAEIDDRIEVAFSTMPDTDAQSTMVHVARALYVWYAQDPVLSSHLLQQTLFLDGPMGEENDAQMRGFLERLQTVLEPRLSESTRHLAEPYVQAFFVDYFGVLVQALREARLRGDGFELDTALARLGLLLALRMPDTRAPLE